MELFLKGRRALITGASKGIGAAVARLLAEEGCNLVLVSRSQDDLDKLAASIKDEFKVAIDCIAADLSKLSEIERVASSIDKLDILVNNAGAIKPGNLLTVDAALWRSCWDLKVFGYIDLTRALYLKLKASGAGVVVNIIGASAETYEPNYICGSTGNAALCAFTRTLGKRSPLDNIRVVGINPGPVATERIEMLLRAAAERNSGDADKWEEAYKGSAFGRAATPEEIAAAVAFLASPRSAFTSGTITTIDDPMRQNM